MKKAARIVASLILAGAMAAPAFAGFEFHGYGRAGVLLNGNGGKADQEGGKDNGTFNVDANAKPFTYSVGRLGNENDNYLEAVLTNTTKAGSVNANTTVRLAYKDHYYNAWANNEAGANGKDNGVGVRELYSEISNLPFAPKSTVWAGKRFYGRDDLHINDFFWRIMDGTGAGITNVPAGPGDLDIAFIVGSRGGNWDGTDEPMDNDKAEDGGRVQKNIDVRYKNLKALGGNFEVGLTYSTVTEQHNKGNADWAKAKDGIGLAGIYGRADFFGMAPGFSKIALQYGTGAQANIGNSFGAYMGEEATAMQLTTFGVANIGEKTKVMSSFVYSNIDEQYGAKNDQESWAGFTVRPQYNFTRNLAVQVEYGMDMVIDGYKKNGETGAAKEKYDGMMHKLTIAPTITLDDTSFWTRPQLRAFVTIATWDKDLKGKTGGDQYADETSGTTYGVQMETWF